MACRRRWAWRQLPEAIDKVVRTSRGSRPDARRCREQGRFLARTVTRIERPGQRAYDRARDQVRRDGRRDGEGDSGRSELDPHEGKSATCNKAQCDAVPASKNSSSANRHAECTPRRGRTPQPEPRPPSEPAPPREPAAPATPARPARPNLRRGLAPSRPGPGGGRVATHKSRETRAAP